MPKFQKILCLTLLIGVCMFPASAFASSNNAASENKKSFLSNILSVFSVSKSNSSNNYNNNHDNQNNNHSNQSNKHKVDKDWDSKGWFDWWDDDDWWDDICWWDKNKDDSYKLWERFYCY